MLGVLDLNISNIGSVVQAFQRVGETPVVINDALGIDRAHALVLPGVGAFKHGIESMRERGLVAKIRDFALIQKKPLIGVCLGMQLLADKSEEDGVHEGLGIVPGDVVRLRPGSAEFRVPNIGWSTAVPKRLGVMFHDLDAQPAFYFVHSYHVRCSAPSAVAAEIDYGSQQVAAAIEVGNVFGVQFHPEKSQDSGLDLLKRLMVHIQSV